MTTKIAPGVLRAATRYALKPFLGPPWPLSFQRVWLHLVSNVNRPSPDAEWEWTEVGGVGTMVARPRGAAPAAGLVYLHGGGYCIGSPATHRGLVTHLAVATQSSVFVPDYRLAPEHPCPAAIDDAATVYEALLDRGVSPRTLILAGDSAGGGLSLATAIRIRDSALPLPAGLVLISPWLDLTNRSESRTRNARLDPMIRLSWSNRCAGHYADERPLDHPECSPLFASHAGLPPVLVQVGTDETALDDSTRLAERCQEEGVEIDLQVFEGMWHVFQSSVGAMTEADRAVGRIADFIDARRA